MASDGFNKSNKPELVAIYRLEFYRNKKKWKFANERKKQPLQARCETSQTKSSQNLNKTYDVEPGSRSYDCGTETSLLNNAFLHEIPQDSPEDVPIAQPPPLAEELWHQQGLEPAPAPSNADSWMNSGTLTGSSYQNIQDTCTICPTGTLQPSNQNQPINNLQLLINSTREVPEQQNLHHQQPWHEPTAERSSSSFIPQHIRTNAAAASNLEPFNSNSWPTPISATHFPDKEMLANLLKAQTQNSLYQKDGRIPEVPPGNCLEMLLCRNKWKKQENTVPNEDDHKVNPAFLPDPRTDSASEVLHSPELNIHPDSWSNQVPSTPPPFCDPVNPDHWYNQPNTAQILLDPHIINQEIFYNETSEIRAQNLVRQEQNSMMSPGLMIQKHPPSLKSCPAERWCDSQKTNMWTNPDLSPNPEELEQYIWTGRLLQQQGDLYQTNDLAWSSAAEDDQDGESDEGIYPVDLQYSAGDQNTLMAQGSLDGETLTPEQIRRNTDEWLRRLLALYASGDDYNADFWTWSEQQQGGLDESTNFIREAHEVPHSSEKDPNETRECMCSYLPASSLPALSPRHLAGALTHSARVLRDVLREQLIRDRLSSLPFLSAVEHPSLDAEALGRRAPKEAAHAPPIIRIDMGRPHRL